MSKKTQKITVPELRFKDFQNKPAWEEKFLYTLGKFTGGGTPSKSNDSYWKGDIPWVSSSDIFEDSIHQLKINKFITKEALKNSATKIVPKNSILLVSRVGVGKLAISKESICTSQDFTNFTPSKINLVFLAYCLKSLSKTLFEYSQGMAIKGFTKEDISKLKLFLPHPDEQQKIADCLSSIDDLITAQTQKLDAFKAHKKGLMQQLFPAEGETVPKLRFPEFRDKKEWSKGTIDNLATTVMGNAFQSSDFVDSGIQLVRMGNLYQGDLLLNRSPVFLPNAFADEFPGFLIQPLELLMSMTGTIGKQDYGFVVQVPKKSKPLLLNQRVVKIIPKDICVKEFLLQLLKSDTLLNKLYSLPGGTKQANLSAPQLRGLEVEFPEQPEQQKIADCLTSIDALITVQTQKIEVLKAHKKGLMQQLFPSVDEVNG